ncbi:hypothetical protein A6A21_04325 [Phocoenobacter uteri]|nr:hypothetical protein [Phocoenobacter uteri]
MVGLNGNGQYYEYAPTDSEAQDSYSLIHGDLTPQVLTNDSSISSSSLWWGALALAPLGLLASRGHSGGNHHSNGSSTEKGNLMPEPEDESHKDETHKDQPKDENHKNEPSPKDNSHQDDPKIEQPNEEGNVLSDRELLNLYKPIFHYSNGKWHDEFKVFGSAEHNAQGKTTVLNYELVEYDFGRDPKHPDNPDDHWYVRIDLDKHLVYGEVGTEGDSQVQVRDLLSNKVDVYLDAIGKEHQAWLDSSKISNINGELKEYTPINKDITHRWDLGDVVDGSVSTSRHSNYSFNEPTSYDMAIQPISAFELI